MKSIKEELKKEYQQYTANQSKKKQNDEQNLENLARNVIETIIIPKFREIYSKQPSGYLYISYGYSMGGVWYSSSIDKLINLGHDGGPCDSSVMSKAVQLAKSEFDINASETDDGGCGTNFNNWEVFLCVNIHSQYNIIERKPKIGFLSTFTINFLI